MRLANPFEVVRSSQRGWGERCTRAFPFDFLEAREQAKTFGEIANFLNRNEFQASKGQ